MANKLRSVESLLSFPDLRVVEEKCKVLAGGEDGYVTIAGPTQQAAESFDARKMAIRYAESGKLGWNKAGYNEHNRQADGTIQVTLEDGRKATYHCVKHPVSGT